MHLDWQAQAAAAAKKAADYEAKRIQVQTKQRELEESWKRKASISLEMKLSAASNRKARELQENIYDDQRSLRMHPLPKPLVVCRH